MTPLPFRALFLFFLLVLTAPLFAQEAAQPGPEVKVVRVTPAEANGAVEVSLTINPTNPDHLVASSIARLAAHPGVTDFAWVSTDAGKTWKPAPLANPRKVQQGDDVIAFTPDGTALHACIAFVGIRSPRPPRAHSAILVRTSRDGLSWSEPAPVIEHFNSVEPHEDKPWLAADHGKTSPHRGSIYISWTKFDVYGSTKPEYKTHVWFSRSKDGGKTFNVPLRISEAPGDAKDSSDTVMGAVPAVGPGGEVYVAWAGPKGLFFAASKDGGGTFGKNVLICPCAGWDFNIEGLGRANGLPSMGVDVSAGPNRGTIYVCFADKSQGDPEVFVVSSRDGGATWSPPTRVAAEPRADGEAAKKSDGKEQWFPWLAVDPVDGSLNIAYYDRAGQDGVKTNVTLARSVDGGRSFVRTRLNPEPYDVGRLGFFGDYLGIDARAGRVALAWMHPLDGTKKLGLSSAVLDFEPGSQGKRK